MFIYRIVLGVGCETGNHGEYNARCTRSAPAKTSFLCGDTRSEVANRSCHGSAGLQSGGMRSYGPPILAGNTIAADYLACVATDGGRSFCPGRIHSGVLTELTNASATKSSGNGKPLTARQRPSRRPRALNGGCQPTWLGAAQSPWPVPYPSLPPTLGRSRRPCRRPTSPCRQRLSCFSDAAPAICNVSHAIVRALRGGTRCERACSSPVRSGAPLPEMDLGFAPCATCSGDCSGVTPASAAVRAARAPACGLDGMTSACGSRHRTS